MSHNSPETPPTIIELFDRQEAVPGIDTATLVLAHEKPSVVTRALHNAAVVEDSFRTTEDDSQTIEDTNVITGNSLSEPPLTGIEYAIRLSKSITDKRRAAEKFLFKVGAGVGMAAVAATFWATFGDWLSHPSSESATVDTHSATHNAAETDESVKRSVEIIGSLGSIVFSLAIGNLVSSAGAGHLAQRRARKEVANVQPQN